MSHTIHQFAFLLHIVAGTLALIVFWLPLCAKKGGPRHVQFGRFFTSGMYIVSVSGLIMSTLVLLDPIGVRAADRALTVEQAVSMAEANRMFAGFLLMLSLLVFNSVRHAILVLKAKADRTLLKSFSHLGALALLGCAGIVMAVVGTLQGSLLFQIFAGLCIANTLSAFHYIFKPALKAREWVIVHLGSIIGAGIGAYTAFFVFGGSRFFNVFFNSESYVVLWILPGVVGSLATVYLSKKYRLKFRVA